MTLANMNNKSRPNIFAQAAKIAASTIKDDVTSSYLSNLTDLKHEAEEVHQSMIDVGKNSKEVFNNFKKNGFKPIVDWFYMGATESEESNLFGQESDFDDGRPSTLADPEEQPEESKSKIISQDEMKDIARGQVNAMYKISGKQVEAQIMSSAEIVNTLRMGCARNTEPSRRGIVEPLVGNMKCGMIINKSG